MVGIRDLIELKKTGRERDYVIIGALAQRLESARDQLATSRSPEAIARLIAQHPELLAAAAGQRPWLAKHVQAHPEAIAIDLDQERREWMRLDRERLAVFHRAAEPWRAHWVDLSTRLAGRPLAKQHQDLCRAPTLHLPMSP